MMTSSDGAAVTVREAQLYYGSKRKPNLVLDSLNMTVPRGVIYGLLGASGCGKTSLLTCMVGLRAFQSGNISVLGSKPGSPGSGIPGPRVGYMPQDIALMGDFNINDTLRYFGRIFGMSASEIKERTRFLVDLLDLPSPKKLIQNFSGGQQRRVSLAAALLHDPELLILDEPTVGLDPLLRKSIWDYLTKLTRVENKTVIITTHYIEEARQADLIGLMRRGKLLAEDTPHKLLQLHGCDTLELVFLKLSRVQALHEGDVPELQVHEPLPLPELPEPQHLQNNTRANGHYYSEEKVKINKSTKFGIMHSLVAKNYLRLIRNKSHLLYIFGFPILQVFIFFLAVGFHPKNLPIAIVNQEVPYDVLLSGCEPSPGCNATRLSCLYLHNLSPDLITQMPYNDIEKAEHDFRSGILRGVLHFGANFSQALAERQELGKDSSDEIIEQGLVHISIDDTNTHLSYLLRTDIFEAYENFLKSYFSSCDLETKLGDFPVNFQTPVYGTRNPTYVSFMAPGIILNIVFFVINGVTCTIMLSEFLEGIWNRTLVTGVTSGQVMVSHVMTQIIVMLVQTAEVIVLTFLGYGLENVGSMVLVVCLTLLVGMCGLVLGILVSATASSMTSAIQITLGSLIPNILLCGAMWPIQGMPRALQIVSEYLPITTSTEALRNIITKGWGIEQYGVYRAFITTAVWVLGLLIASSLAVRHKKP